VAITKPAICNQIRIENPDLWTKAFQDEIRATVRAAAELEAAYGRDTKPRGFLGLNAALCETYMHFIANRRCAQLGLSRVFAPTCYRKQEGDPMYVMYGVLVIAMLFIFFLPITDYKTVRMKLCVLCALALVLAVSVTTRV
jgi:ribonucleotide reductase beta subunit family protein with ferritin-like domain